MLFRLDEYPKTDLKLICELYLAESNEIRFIKIFVYVFIEI